MSGRLIILPKKSYCPWKPENVERVLRDERLERERLEREEKELRQQESKQRLATLKGTTTGSSADAAPQTHVNLFEPEEQAMAQMALMVEKEKKQVGIVPLRFDKVKQEQDQPFYVRPLKARHDDQYKARMDPMKAFVRPAHKKNDGDADNPHHDDHGRKSSRKRSHHRKHSSRQDKANWEDSSRHDRKRKKRKSSNKGESNNSVEDLRRRRQEREQTESQREARLSQQVDSRNDRHRHYQDQFHPELSRR